jgi:hypothetical protein
MKLPVLLPPLENMTHFTVLCKVRHLYAIRSSCLAIRIPPVIRLVFAHLFRLAVHPDVRVRQTTASYIQTFAGQFVGFDDVFRQAVTTMSDPALDLDSLSGLAGALCGIPNMSVSMTNVTLLADVARAICRPLPADLPDQSVRSLRQIIIVMLEQLDPCDPRLPKAEFAAMRKRVANDAIVKYGQMRGNRETENYSAALVCATMIGDPMLIRADLFAFLIPFLATDDPVVRVCASHVLAMVIEWLIPRVARKRGTVVDYVTPGKYDTVEFIGRPYPHQANTQAVF